MRSRLYGEQHIGTFGILYVLWKFLPAYSSSDLGYQYIAILDHNFSAGARTAVFLACLIQSLAVVATNLASNEVPVGSDLTGLFPRYFK